MTNRFMFDDDEVAEALRPVSFHDALEKYDPDELRDEIGRWTSGGGTGSALNEPDAANLAQSIDDDVAFEGYAAPHRDAEHHPGGVAFASPNVADLDFPHAHEALTGHRQKVFEKAGQDIDHQLGIFGSQSGVIGAWSDGAENSTMLETGDNDVEKLRLSAAMKGHLGAQKAVLVFAGGGDNGGPHALYDMTVNTPPAETHAALLKSGIPFHTLTQAGNGTRALVVDTDGSLGKNVGDFAAANHTTATRTLGNAEFIGDDQGTGTDAEQRQRGRDAYERVIASYSASKHPGGTAGEIWQGVRNRWGQEVATAKRRLSFSGALRGIAKIAQPGSLYVHRPLLNAAQLHAWASSAGIKNLVPPEEMHVTQVYSRTPVALQPDRRRLIVKRHVASLGNKGAVVLHFDSPELQARHKEAMDAGASHDWPSYQTHVTLSYDAGDADLSAVGAPDFPLEFGPEVHAPINENWAEDKGLR